MIHIVLEPPATIKTVKSYSWVLFSIIYWWRLNCKLKRGIHLLHWGKKIKNNDCILFPALFSVTMHSKGISWGKNVKFCKHRDWWLVQDMYCLCPKIARMGSSTSLNPMFRSSRFRKWMKQKIMKHTKKMIMSSKFCKCLVGYLRYCFAITSPGIWVYSECFCVLFFKGRKWLKDSFFNTKKPGRLTNCKEKISSFPDWSILRLMFSIMFVWCSVMFLIKLLASIHWR